MYVLCMYYYILWKATLKLLTPSLRVLAFRYQIPLAFGDKLKLMLDQEAQTLISAHAPLWFQFKNLLLTKKLSIVHDPPLEAGYLDDVPSQRKSPISQSPCRPKTPQQSSQLRDDDLGNLNLEIFACSCHSSLSANWNVMLVKLF